MGPETDIVLARFLYYGSVAVLFGATLFPFYATAERATGHRFAMPRSLHAALALVSFLSAVLWLLIFATSLGGADDLLGTVHALLFSSRLGPSWLARLGLVTLLLLAAVTGRPGFIAGAAFVTLLAEGWSGHGAGAGFVGPSLHAVHAVSAAAWVGGLVALAHVVAAARSGHMERSVAEEFLRRFSRFGILVVLLLAATGAAMTWLMLGDVPRPSNGYGRVLLLKIGLFALMVGLALINRFLLVPRLGHSERRPALRLLSAAIVLEQIAGAAVLLAVAALGLMDPDA